jgi:YD repeat-containing protein
MKKYLYLLIIAILNLTAVAQGSQAQTPIKTDLPTIMPPSPTVAALMKFEEVPVNNYTGKPDVTIPLFSSSTLSNDINLNISLKYNPSSVAAEERASDVGLGWSLMAGGTISRTVRGLPDEYHKNDRVGVYHNTGQSPHNNYYTFVDLNVTNDSDFYESEEFQWEANEKGKYDTEHDLWQFNFMGFTGRFYIKKNGSTGMLEVIKLDDSNVKIINKYDDSNEVSRYVPTSFEVYDDKGFKYVFDIVETTNQNTYVESIGYYGDSSCSLLTDFIKSNITATTSYKSAFHLSKVYDTNGQLLIELLYNNDNNVYKEIVIDESIKESRVTTFDAQLYIQAVASIACVGTYCLDGLSAPSRVEPTRTISKSNRNTNVKKLTEINIIGKARLSFNFSKGRDDENFVNPDSSYVFRKLIIRNWPGDTIKKFYMVNSYSKVIYNRLMLKQVIESNYNDTKRLTYNLFYKENKSNLEVSKDYWGYFNLVPYGFMKGNDAFKEVNPQFCSTDVLQKMELPEGGCIVFDYESNSYTYQGNVLLTNFDENPNNWNHVKSDPYLFTSSDTNTIQELNFSATENQKITLYPSTENLGENGGVSLLKNGVVVPNYTNLICAEGTEECGVDFILEANSHYGLKLWWVNPDVSATASIVVEYHQRKSITENWLYGGGIRIKRIGYFDINEVAQDYYEDFAANSQVYAPKKELNYNYCFFGTNTSSGSLTFPKPLYKYQQSLDTGIHCVDIPDIIFDYEFITHFNNFSTMKTKGADVGYKNVTVFENGNGKTEFSYDTAIDYPEEDYSYCLKPPFLQSENIDYKRGTVRIEKIYDNTSRLLSEVDYDYEYEESTEKTGIKLFMFPINCPDNFRYASYDQFLYASQHPATGFWHMCNDGANATDFIGNQFINEAVGWTKLSNKRTFKYFYDTSNASRVVQTNETFTYNPINKKIEEQTASNSLGEITKTKYYYLQTLDNNNSKNNISQIEKVEVYNNNALLSSNHITYANNWDVNNSYLPFVIETAKSTADLESRVRFTKYDSYGHALELQQENGTFISYIWGYRYSQPIAKIENTRYVDIDQNLLQLAISASDNAHTGLETNLLNALQAIRTSLPNAMVTTFTYLPLVGVVTITDPRGYKSTYDYDSFGRLSEIKDAAGNQLSTNEYHYRTQN